MYWKEEKKTENNKRLEAQKRDNKESTSYLEAQSVKMKEKALMIHMSINNNMVRKDINEQMIINIAEWRLNTRIKL